MASLNLDLILGPQVICTQIGSYLFGLMTLQTYLFFYNFPNDNVRLKCLVAIYWLLKAVHWLFSTIALYQLTVDDFGKPENFNIVPYSLEGAYTVTSILYLITQSFFCYRIYVISEKWIITTMCLVLVVIRAATMLALVTFDIKENNLEKFSDEFIWLFLVMFGIGVVVDAAIAILQSYFLWKRGQGTFRRTRDIVETLIKWTLQTGLLTFLMTLTTTICLITLTKTWVWLGLFTIAPGIWTNSLLATLNGRIILGSRGDLGLSVSLNLDSGATPNSHEGSSTTAAPIDIELARHRRPFVPKNKTIGSAVLFAPVSESEYTSTKTTDLMYSHHGQPNDS